MIWGQNFKFLLSQFIVKLDLEMTFANVVECYKVICFQLLTAAIFWFFQEVTVEPRYNKVLDITNDFFYPRNKEIYEEEP